MTLMRSREFHRLLAILTLVAGVAACDDSIGPVNTTLRGNAVAVFPNGDEERSMSVCVRGTPVCGLTNSSGFFELDAPVAGHVFLLLTANSASAKLNLTDIPANSVVTMNDIVCDMGLQICAAASIIIATPAAPTPTPTPTPTATPTAQI